jgi:deazaflavin-dependent oxidoreductase (nitroreductase family)
MSELRHLSVRDRVALWTESIFMTKLVSKYRVGPLLRFFFRLPLFFQRIGLGLLIPRNVLILTTTGRRSGRPHRTPVEFGAGPGGQQYMVMSGWDGHTDWYRNACADPCVRVWLRGREWEARAEPAPDAEVAEVMKHLARLTPLANRMWSRWAGFAIDGSDASYLAAAPHFPSFYLKPLHGEDG